MTPHAYVVLYHHHHHCCLLVSRSVVQLAFSLHTLLLSFHQTRGSHSTHTDAGYINRGRHSLVSEIVIVMYGEAYYLCEGRHGNESHRFDLFGHCHALSLCIHEQLDKQKERETDGLIPVRWILEPDLCWSSVAMLSHLSQGPASSQQAGLECQATLGEPHGTTWQREFVTKDGAKWVTCMGTGERLVTQVLMWSKEGGSTILKQSKKMSAELLLYPMCK